MVNNPDYICMSQTRPPAIRLRLEYNTIEEIGKLRTYEYIMGRFCEKNIVPSEMILYASFSEGKELVDNSVIVEYLFEEERQQNKKMPKRSALISCVDDFKINLLQIIEEDFLESRIKQMKEYDEKNKK